MTLLADGLFTYPSASGLPLNDHHARQMAEHYPAAICHLRLYRTPGNTLVVIVGELTDNPGMSVTNAAERLRSLIRLDITAGHPFTLIEHYPGTTHDTGRYDHVHFRPDGTAYWQPSNQALIENLLLGQTLQTWTHDTYLQAAFTPLPNNTYAPLRDPHPKPHPATVSLLEHTLTTDTP